MVKISRRKVTRRTPCRYGQLNIKCASSTQLHNFHCVDHYHYSDRMFAATYQIITCLHFSISFVFIVFSNSGEITRPGAMFALTHPCVGKLAPGVRRGGRCGATHWQLVRVQREVNSKICIQPRARDGMWIKANAISFSYQCCCEEKSVDAVG